MSAGWRKSDLTLPALAFGVAIVLAGLSFVAAPAVSTPAVDGSSYGAHPRGTRAAYLALREAGYHVERTFEPLVQLERQPADAVLVLIDPRTGPSRQDKAALERFVSRGGTLLAAGASSVPFLPDPPFRRGGERPASESLAPASMFSPLSRGVPEVRLAPPRASLSEAAAYVPVYGDARTPYVLAARIGSGRVLWWSDGRALSNTGIAQRGHAELLANMLGAPGEGQLVLWDEHYHGFTRSLWSYLAGTPVPYAMLQLALVFAAFLFAFSRRRAPTRVPREEPRTSPLEFVDSMGALYERARAAAGAVETVRAHARRAMLAATGLPASAGDRRVSQAVAARTGLDAGALSDLLARSEAAARSPRLAPDGARTIVAALQDAAGRLRVLSPQRPRPGRT